MKENPHKQHFVLSQKQNDGLSFLQRRSYHVSMFQAQISHHTSTDPAWDKFK
jgi:hypothetical protein